MRRCRPTKRTARRRPGAALAETAVMLPVLVIMVFGAIELANGIYLKQALTVAAYEGVRRATRPGASASEARARVNEVMQVRRVPDFQFTISPSVVPTTQRGTEVTVTVTAPGDSFGFGVVPLLGDVELTGQACMVRQ